MFRQPILILRDTELIKKVAIKGFDHFVNRNAIIDPDTDPLFGRSLVTLKGQVWVKLAEEISK